MRIMLEVRDNGQLRRLEVERRGVDAVVLIAGRKIDGPSQVEPTTLLHLAPPELRALAAALNVTADQIDRS